MITPHLDYITALSNAPKKQFLDLLCLNGIDAIQRGIKKAILEAEQKAYYVEKKHLNRDLKKM